MRGHTGSLDPGACVYLHACNAPRWVMHPVGAASVVSPSLGIRSMLRAIRLSCQPPVGEPRRPRSDVGALKLRGTGLRSRDDARSRPGRCSSLSVRDRRNRACLETGRDAGGGIADCFCSAFDARSGHEDLSPCLRPAIGRSGACPDGTLTRWRCAAGARPSAPLLPRRLLHPVQRPERVGSSGRPRVWRTRPV